MIKWILAPLLLAGLATAVRADTVTYNYTATEQLTSETPTSETFSWTFTGPQVFDAIAAFADVGPPCAGDSCRFYWDGGSGADVISGKPIPFTNHTLSIAQGFGLSKPDCFVDGPNAFLCNPNVVNEYDVAFGTIGNPFQTGISFVESVSFVGSTDPPSSDPPVSTPEPASLLLMVSGVLGMPNFRKLLA